MPESITEPECKRPKIDLDDTDKDVSFRVNFKCPACFRKRLNIKVNADFYREIARDL